MKHNFLAIMMYAPLIDYAGGHTGELTFAQVSSIARLTPADFTGSLTYYVPEKVGPANDPAAELYIMRAVKVNANDLFRSCSEFIEHVRAGRAYAAATVA